MSSRVSTASFGHKYQQLKGLELAFCYVTFIEGSAALEVDVSLASLYSPI